MRVILLIAAVAQVALAGTQFSVRMPFQNPAGVTYVEGPSHSALAAGPSALGYAGPAVGYAGPAVGYAGPAVGYAGPAVGYAGPAVGYAAPAAVGYAAPAVGYAAPAVTGYATHAVAAAPVAYGQHQDARFYAAVQAAGGSVDFAAPTGYGYATQGVAAAPVVQATAPLGYAAPAIGYAHAKVPAIAEVPTLHHVHGVADVPVTRVQANHGVIQKIVDVAHPATATRKFEVRRPAIQKQFYDIEERVIVRNAGSALVELDEPLSKAQRGPTVISRNDLIAPVQPIFVGSTPAPPLLIHPTPAPALLPIPSPQPPNFIVPSPQPPIGGPTPPPFVQSPGSPSFDSFDNFEGDSDSVVVENSDLGARSRSAGPSQRLQQQQQQIFAQQQELQARQDQLNVEVQQEQQFQSRRQYQGPQQFSRGRTATEARLAPFPRQPSFDSAPAVDVRSNGAPLDLIPQARGGPSVVPSLRSSPEVNQANQQRLIELLTARGGVTEVGLGRSGPSGAPVGDLGPVRARVLSATPAPPQSNNPAGERVSTRRVVVSRPIETVQEFDVVEPATKLERVAVNHPTVYKTVHHEVARVPTSVPVYGKALAHTYAHAQIPVGFGLVH